MLTFLLDRFNRFDDFLKQKQKDRRAKYICRFEHLIINN